MVEEPRPRGGVEGTMRLDRFLWWARLAKTRAAAQAIAAAGHLRLDGRAVDKAAAGVRVGSIVTLMAQGRVRALRVVALPVRRGPAPEAQACYEELVTEGAGGRLPADPGANDSQRVAAD